MLSSVICFIYLSIIISSKINEINRKIKIKSNDFTDLLVLEKLLQMDYDEFLMQLFLHFDKQ
jgi:hypothetical protein